MGQEPTADELGIVGESRLSTLCSQAKLICNKSTQDVTCWDFLVEFPISVAHVAALELIEGTSMNDSFRPDDCPDFINTHEDPMVEAHRLLVEDVTGTRYAVTKSEKHLKQLFAAWRP